jgi:hypothetical protein
MKPTSLFVVQVVKAIIKSFVIMNLISVHCKEIATCDFPCLANRVECGSPAMRGDDSPSF